MSKSQIVKNLVFFKIFDFNRVRPKNFLVRKIFFFIYDFFLIFSLMCFYLFSVYRVNFYLKFFKTRKMSLSGLKKIIICFYLEKNGRLIFEVPGQIKPPRFGANDSNRSGSDLVSPNVGLVSARFLYRSIFDGNVCNSP